MKKYNVAIVGATGAVGEQMRSILEERDFPVENMRYMASSRSAGKKLPWKDTEIEVENLEKADYSGIDIALFSAGGDRSKQYAHKFVEAGAVVIDNSSAFRMDEGVPLIVPEVNPDDVAEHKGIIANPNCSTIIMLLPLWPLHQKKRVKRVVVSTYQAASGAGAQAMLELEEETQALLKGENFERTVIPHQYAFNLFPHNSSMTDNGYCEEEIKMVKETRKIFHEKDFRVTATCVRVPILRAHSESLNIEFENDISAEEIYDILGKAPGVEVLEDRAANRWPMPIDASGKDPVYAGRVRKDISNPNTYEMWIVGDQIRKGAALNAIQIAEILIEKQLL
jgi:aspartate-semialdehyde dehydrogenase